MPTFTEVSNVAGVVRASTIFAAQRTITRDSGGRLWMVYYDATYQYLYLKTSSDNGSTWSAAELLYDHGASAASNTWIAVAMGWDNTLGVLVRGTGTGIGRTITIRKKVGSPWVVGPNIATGLDERTSGLRLMCDQSTGLWWMGSASNPSSVEYLQHYFATDPQINWGALKQEQITGHGGVWSGSEGSSDCCLNAAGYIEHMTGVYYPTSGVYRVWWNSRTIANSVTNEVAWTCPTVTASAPFHPRRMHMAIDGDGYVHAAWMSAESTYPTEFQIHYLRGKNGVGWDAAEFPYGAAQTGKEHELLGIALNGNDPVIIAAQKGLGVNTANLNLHHWKKSSGVWTRSTITDRPTNVIPMNGSIVHESWNSRNRFANGVAFLAYQDLANDQIDFFRSDDWSAVSDQVPGPTDVTRTSREVSCLRSSILPA